MNADTNEAMAVILSAAHRILHHGGCISNAAVESTDETCAMDLHTCVARGKEINEAALDILAALNSLGVK